MNSSALRRPSAVRGTASCRRTHRCSVLALARCILARQLRSHRIKSLFLALKACLAAPSAAQIVSHAEGELAEAVDLELDPIAVLECMQPAVIGAARQDVAGLERVQCACPLDASRDLVCHVRSVKVLSEHAIVPQ